MELTEYITPEMASYHFLRTTNHIDRVQQNAKKIDQDFGLNGKLIEKTEKHDLSKFEEPERLPYILITEKYRQRDLGNEIQYPKKIEDLLTEVTVHHILHNDHHPEFWDKNFDISKFNQKNRDGIPTNPVEAYRMPKLCIMEMCADWMAVGAERGNSSLDFAKSNVNRRWLFDDEQKKLIFDILKHYES